MCLRELEQCRIDGLQGSDEEKLQMRHSMSRTNEDVFSGIRNVSTLDNCRF
jgi:hypothetical protein